MLTTIKEKLNQKTNATGIEILQIDEQFFFNIVELKRKKEQVEIIKVESSIQGFENCFQHLNPNTPIFIALNVRGLLHQNVKLTKNTNQEYLELILPNAKADDFYIQTNSIINHTVVSIIRKNTVHPIINQFIAAKLKILSISLGSFQVQSALPLLNEYNEIETFKYVLKYNDDKELVNYQENESLSENQTILIGNRWLNTFLVVAFSTAFEGLLNISNTITNPAIEEQQEEYIQERLFKFSLTTFLGTLLTILIVNFLLFTKYNTENQTLSINAIQKEQQLAQLEKLKSKVKEQKGLTNLLQSKTSFYADRIAASVPKNIELMEMTIFPEKANSFYEEESRILYENKIINLKGRCTNSFEYNQWLKTLRKIQWIIKVENINYQDINENYSQFEVQLTIS